MHCNTSENTIGKYGLGEYILPSNECSNDANRALSCSLQQGAGDQTLAQLRSSITAQLSLMTKQLLQTRGDEHDKQSGAGQGTASSRNSHTNSGTFLGCLPI